MLLMELSDIQGKQTSAFGINPLWTDDSICGLLFCELLAQFSWNLVYRVIW